MAMMDDPQFLISHIRNSFITSDDTGMCEVVLEAEQYPEHHQGGAEKRPTTWHGKSGEGPSSCSDSGLESDNELAHSYDILPDMDFASHRRRSNTAQRLEKIKQEKRKQSKIKHIQWKDVQHTVNEIGEYFEKKDISDKVVEVPKKSLLTQQLQQIRAVPDNPFMEYAKFDGRASGGVHTKKIDIFLTMATGSERSYPLSVVTIATAKIQDLIGLICWQYTTENRQPALNKHLEAFSLHIAEDDGEVDMDFPALDQKEPISKFGFSKLALVEKELPKTPTKSDIVVTVDLQHRGLVKMSVDNESILMKDILERIMSQRKLHQRPGLEYRLEKQDDPSAVVDLTQSLADAATNNFCLIRENSARGTPEVASPEGRSEIEESLSSLHYKSYVVNMVHKLRTNKEVQLGVSGDKIEIDPISTTKGLFKVKQKPVTLDIEDIAACNMLIDGKSSGKSIFRLVYQSSQEIYKHHDFECEASMASIIVQKVNNILEMRSSPVRKDYKVHKERKYKRPLLGL